MRTLRTPVLLLVVALSVAACSRRGGEEAGSNNPAPVYAGPIKIVVDNRHWQDITLYVLHDGQRSRVGTVTATTIGTFSIPPHQIGQTGLIRLIADPVGSQVGISSETIVVKPGQEVQWTLESQLRRSSVAVY
jgi:hypothetical protein